MQSPESSPSEARAGSRAMVAQLQSDFDRLNGVHLGGRLRAPVWHIVPNMTAWGSWDATTRTLSLRESLLWEHPWGAVLEVLKHEMAHQVVHELFGLHDVADHGEAWRRACGMLGIVPQARGEVVSGLPGGDALPAPLRRIRKLLALSTNNPSPPEAAAALTAAQRLMAEHGVCPGDESAAYAVTWAGPSLARVPRHRYALAALLEAHFRVACIWIPSFNTSTQRSGSQLELCGTPLHVKIAGYAHDAIVAQLLPNWERHRRTTGRGGLREKNAYLDGLLDGLKQALDAEKDVHQEAGLVVRNDPRLAAFFRRRHPRVRRSSVKTAGHGTARRMGEQAGRRIQVRPGMESSASLPRRLTGKTDP